jgi:hypothetical protein
MSSPPAWWAKIQTAGPLRVPLSDIPPGMASAPEDDGASAWLLPGYPDGSGHATLAEIGSDAVPLEHPTVTRRVLIVVVCLCWHDQMSGPWPGRPVERQTLVTAFRSLKGHGDSAAAGSVVSGALNQLQQTGWVLVDGQTVRLGPRVALWPAADLAELREICRDLADIRRHALGEETS